MNRWLSRKKCSKSILVPPSALEKKFWNWKELGSTLNPFFLITPDSFPMHDSSLDRPWKMEYPTTGFSSSNNLGEKKFLLGLFTLCEKMALFGRPNFSTWSMELGSVYYRSVYSPASGLFNALGIIGNGSGVKKLEKVNVDPSSFQCLGNFFFRQFLFPVCWISVNSVSRGLFDALGGIVIGTRVIALEEANIDFSSFSV
jgi:hypothetical protein